MSAAHRDPPPIADEPPEPPERLEPLEVSSGTVVDAGRRPFARFLMQVLWPAFLGAAITVGVMFSLVDPLEVDVVHSYLNGSRELAYTCAFVALWLPYALACALTWLLSATDRRRR